MGIITIIWGDGESSKRYVQHPESFKSAPPYGACWKFKECICYTTCSGYYRFYNNGSVTLDDGVKSKECPDISFRYESTTREVKNMSYDYREAVKDDVLEYIRNEIDFTEFDAIEELEEKLNEELFTEDSVTGNASGSYTFSTWEAEGNICHNLDLLGEALTEFGSGADYLINNGAEAADVIIRCYLLGECIAAALEEIEDEFNEAHEDDEDNEE